MFPDRTKCSNDYFACRENRSRVMRAQGYERTHDGRLARWARDVMSTEGWRREVSSDFAAVVGSGNWDTNHNWTSAVEGSLD